MLIMRDERWSPVAGYRICMAVFEIDGINWVI